MQEIHRIEGSEGDYKLTLTTKRNIQVCWVRTDRNVKKVAFFFSQHGDDLDDKASVSTIEEIGERIESLQYKLDLISLGISA